MGIFRQKWYWVCATTGGKSILLSPPQKSESAARGYAQKMLGGNFYTIEEMDTADQTKATRAYRAKILQQTHNIPAAISRMMHKVKKEEEPTEIAEIEVDEIHNEY